MKVRGVVHACTPQISDSAKSLGELKKSLFAHGISFCCVTQRAESLDETTATAFVADCHALSDQAFVFIPGFEVSYKDVSLLLIGTGVFLGKRVDEALLRRWREVTPLIFLARSGTTSRALNNTLLSLIDGVEVWSQELDGSRSPHFKTLQFFNQLRGFKPELRALGSVAVPDVKKKCVPELVLEIDAPHPAEIVRQLSLGFYTIESGRTTLASDGTFISGGGLLTKLASLWGRVVSFVGKSA